MHTTRQRFFKRNTLSTALLLALGSPAMADPSALNVAAAQARLLGGGGSMISPFAFNPVTPSTRREVTDGTANNVIPAGSAVATDGGSPAEAAILAVNPGSRIHGENLTITGKDDVGAPHGFGAFAQAGGNVTLTGDATRISALFGLVADGAGSSVSMTGGRIDAPLRAVEVESAGRHLCTG